MRTATTKNLKKNKKVSSSKIAAAKKGLSKEDTIVYEFLSKNEILIDLIAQNLKIPNTIIKAVNPLKKIILLNNKKVVPIKDIKQIFIKNKIAGEFLINKLDSTIDYFKPFQGSSIIFDYILEDLSLKRFYGKFRAMLKYQIAIETTKSINLVYKIALSSFSFINPYPEQLIEYTDDKERWEAGKWREYYKDIKEIWKEEITNKEKFYKVYIALKDGRNIKGLMRHRDIFEANIRVYANKSMRESIFIFNHAIADILDIEESN